MSDRYESSGGGNDDVEDILSGNNSPQPPKLPPSPSTGAKKLELPPVRRGRLSLKTKAGLAAGALAIGVIGDYFIENNDWGNTLAKSKTKEAITFAGYKQKGAKCLDGVVLLRSRVNYRETSDMELGRRFKIARFISKSNVAGTIGDDQEISVARPMIEQDGPIAKLNFDIVNKTPTAPKKPSKATELELADRYVSVNYTALKDDNHDLRKDSLVTFDYSGEPVADLPIKDCPLTSDGRVIMANEQPAAYGTIDSAGSFEQFNAKNGHFLNK